MNPRNFFAELKRCNVYKVAVAYIVASWLLIQAASILFPAFDAPAAAIRILVILLILGFPIALAFSAQAQDGLLALLKSQPNNAGLYDALAGVYAGLDDREAAMRNSDQAFKSVPITKDAVDGVGFESNHARLQARFGDREHTIPALERLLKLPGYLTPSFLRLDPDFDPLRGDSRFEKLCQEK